MKKNICIYFILTLFAASLFAQDSDFIKINSVKTVIGNDDFKAMQKSFTGVAGEVNEVKMKYYRKEHDVELSEYSIQKYLVTYDEFQTFLNDTSYRTAYEKERKSSYNKEIKDPFYPVKKITFIDAVAYCQWMSDKKGRGYRLPTNAEWEYAALFGKKKIFPWGNEPKILSDTGTQSRVGREKFTVSQIQEDETETGMRNVMGGVEYTLDCYDNSFYENSPVVNPVCFIPENAACLMRGIREYNDLEEDVFGLYEFSGNTVSNYNGYSYFRIVQADETVFNKGTADEAVYFTCLGKASQVKAFEHPSDNSKYVSYDVCSDLYILFKSTDGQYLRCFFQVMEEDPVLGGRKKFWKFGWVNKNEIQLSKLKWYEK